MIKVFGHILLCGGMCVMAAMLSIEPAYAKTYPAFGPLTIRNQNPVYLESLGLTPTRATVLPRGSLELRADWAYSNIFEQGASATRRLDLDMELSRVALHAIYGLRDDIEVGVEVPLYTLWHGFLDGFIQSFHRFFGLPNGGRDRVPDNQYRYTFDAGGCRTYGVSAQPFMIGDIVLSLKHHIHEESATVPGIAWFADLKFPTGSNGRGTGNDAFDFGVGVAIEKSWKRLHGYLNAAYMVTGANAPYEPFMRHTMLAFASALEVTLLDTWSVIVQLAGSTPLLAHTGIDAWDGTPMDLVVGFRGEERGLIGGHDLIWQAGFSEDVLSKGPSVDFTAFASIGVRFHRREKVFNKSQWLAGN